MSPDPSSGAGAVRPGDEEAGLLGSKAVDVGMVERELARLWSHPSPAQAGEQRPVRARMSNLVVLCTSEALASSVLADVPPIVRRHPSRVLFLAAEASGPPALDASVAAYCHRAGQGAGAVCAEQITLRAGGHALNRLPGLVRSLVIGDLPTSLWWIGAEAPPLAGELFEALAAMADQVLYDSTGWVDPVSSVVAMGRWADNEAGRRAISDLAWRRLKPWRRLIGQCLSDDAAPGALESIFEVVVEYGPHALPQAWLLVGWLACRLDWCPEAGKVAPGEEVSWSFRSPRKPVAVRIRRRPAGEPRILSLSLACAPGGRPMTARFTHVGPDRLTFTAEGAAPMPRMLAAPAASRSDLVARQLPDLGRDPVFRKTLELSRVMAEALLP